MNGQQDPTGWQVPDMTYVFLIFFIVSTSVHLYASIRKDQRMRNITKPMILLSLMGFYVFAVRSFSWIALIALLFSWIGDVLLMQRGVKWFISGGIAFTMSHVFFIIRYMQDIDFGRVPVLLIVCCVVLFTSLVVMVFSKLTRHLPGGLAVPMFLYLLLNGVMNCFAVFRCASVPNLLTVLTAIGALLFFISDATLFIVRFHKGMRMKLGFVKGVFNLFCEMANDRIPLRDAIEDYYGSIASFLLC